MASKRRHLTLLMEPLVIKGSWLSWSIHRMKFYGKQLIFLPFDEEMVHELNEKSGIEMEMKRKMFLK